MSQSSESEVDVAEVARRLVEDEATCPRCGATLIGEWGDDPGGDGAGVLVCPVCDSTSDEEDSEGR